jgi:hypothetical protein
MFSKTNGPTALRADLVRALSFSHGRIERLGAGATVSSLAALAGVWNGHKGHVALIVRGVEPALIERYVGSNPISSEADLDAVIEQGLAFAESLGFSMDAPEFLILSPEEREARIYRWNKLRKLRQASSVAPVDESSPSIPALEAQDLAQAPIGYEIELEDLAVPQPLAAPEFYPPSAVLGRVSLVRKGSSDARRLELLAKLLASY